MADPPKSSQIKALALTHCGVLGLGRAVRYVSICFFQLVNMAWMPAYTSLPTLRHSQHRADVQGFNLCEPTRKMGIKKALKSKKQKTKSSGVKGFRNCASLLATDARFKMA